MFEHMAIGGAGQLREQLARLVGALDPDVLRAPVASELWGVLDSVERLAAAGKTLLARRLTEPSLWQASGSRSAAEFLARRAGGTVGAAREALGASELLARLPGTAAAVRRGELSAGQAAAIAQAASADPDAESRLLELAARTSLAELREECARVRAAADPDPDATNRRLHARRRLRRFTDSEGGWNLVARGTPQAGAEFNAALDPVIEEVFREACREGRRDPQEAYAFDALLRLVERGTGHAPRGTAPGSSSPTARTTTGRSSAQGSTPGGSGSSEPAHTGARPGRSAGSACDSRASTQPRSHEGTSAGAPDSDVAAEPTEAADPVDEPEAPASAAGAAPPARPNPRYMALLRVDVEALRRGGVRGEETCEISGVGPVPVRVARGLLGEAIVKLVITRGTDVLNVTHLGRGPTAAQRAALMWTSPQCTVEGCTRTRVEVDHREEWARTRRTRLDELDHLCEFHHGLKSRLGWALVAGTGKRPMVPPGDPRHPRHASRATRTDAAADSAYHGAPASPPGGLPPLDAAGEPAAGGGGGGTCGRSP